MLTLLIGPDDFTKKEYVFQLAKKQQADLEFFRNPAALPSLEELTQQNLFSKPKVFVLEGLVEKFASPDITVKLAKSKNEIIFIEEKLDKRKANLKNLLADKNIAAKEFVLPHGKELDKWIGERAKFFGAKISLKAIDALAKKLGRDEFKETRFGGKVAEVKEAFNLWQADSEIKKLADFSRGEEIREDAVEKLSFENFEVDALSIVNAIADGNKLESLNLLHGFLDTESGTDEKGSIIMLNALLAEQFRNVAMVQDFLQDRTPDAEILEKTSWKPGRLFIIKKVAGRFAQKKVMDFLGKLEHLDEELKTSSTPPKVLLDMIVAQLF